jgi:hypothetical protein
MGHNLKQTYDVVLGICVLYFYGGVSWWTINWGIVLRKKEECGYRNHEPKPEPKVERDPEPSTDGFRPLIRVDGKVQYAHVVATPQLDKERYVAFTILRQKENNFPVDLTEDRWVKNWKFIRREFVEMLDLWKQCGVIVRAGSRRNSPYVVRDWKTVKEIADGVPLPRLH